MPGGGDQGTEFATVKGARRETQVCVSERKRFWITGRPFREAS